MAFSVRPSSLRPATAALALIGLALDVAAPVRAAAAPLRGPGESAPLDLPGPRTSAGHAAGAGSGLVRTFVGLAIVIAVIYGLYWVLKQVKASREGRPTGSGLEAIASVPLGPSGSLHLVRAGQELVLIGVGERGVVPIRTYDEDAARAAGLLDDEAVPELEAARPLALAAPPRRSSTPAALALLQALRRATVR